MDWTFKGGIHPYGGKKLTKESPVKELLPEGDMVYPLSQHIGAWAKALVKKGDYVKMGQQIAKAEGIVSADIVSSVSGTVKAVEERTVPSGDRVNSIVIENDGQYTPIDGLGKERDYTGLSKEEIRGLIKEAGIVGLGGAGFPAHVKLAPKNDEQIDYVIVNGAECEPYLTSGYRMMVEEPQKVIGGLNVILRLFDRARGVIAIEDNKPEAIKRIGHLVQKEGRIEVRPLKTKYPQGAERNLIYAVTGRKINSSMLPADAGCIVNNVDTVIAVYMAVCRSTPLMERTVTVTGDAVKEPGNFRVKIGTSYAQVINAAGGFKTEPEKIISGGPMMGTALYSLEVPVVKTSSAILCMTKDEVLQEEPGPCIRCGRCVKACPENLVPQRMMECVEQNNMEEFARIQGMECCECGCCTYVCPAKRPLTQAFKLAKRVIAKERRRRKEG